MLTSSTPSPDMENNGLLLEDVPLLLSITTPPLAPAFSIIRAFSESLAANQFCQSSVEQKSIADLLQKKYQQKFGKFLSWLNGKFNIHKKLQILSYFLQRCRLQNVDQSSQKYEKKKKKVKEPNVSHVRPEEPCHSRKYGLILASCKVARIPEHFDCWFRAFHNLSRDFLALSIWSTYVACALHYLH